MYTITVAYAPLITFVECIVLVRLCGPPFDTTTSLVGVERFNGTFEEDEDHEAEGGEAALSIIMTGTILECCELSTVTGDLWATWSV